MQDLFSTKLMQDLFSTKPVFRVLSVENFGGEILHHISNTVEAYKLW